MPFQKISRDQIEPPSPFGYDLEVAHTLSAAVVNLTRSWEKLDLHDDPIREMRVQLLGMLNPIDAMAFLAREEAAHD